MRVKTMIAFLALAGIMMSQSTVSGTITDAESNDALIGANVYAKGTTIGAATDENGDYSFSIENGQYTIVASYIGYKSESKSISVLDDMTLDFELNVSLLSAEVVVTANRARIRETPVAFTNVGGEELQKNYVTQDVPDLISTVPGVFTNSNGLGEGEIYVRGFDAEHIQIMINGVPVNDPESQKTYWSNWSGLSSSAKDIQIQRGVGSSLYGSGSFGGSVNIEYGDFNPEREIIVYTAGVDYSTKSGGTARNGVLGFKYTSGLSENGKWNFLFGYENKSGDSYVRNTNYRGHSITAGAEYFSGKHKLTFNFVGAPQSHNQARTSQDLALIKILGREYNRNDHRYQENYYFKPQYELHHKWLINNNTQWNTNVFYTTGKGGGTYLRNDSFDVNTGQVNFKNASDATDAKYFGRHALYIFQKTGQSLSGFNSADSMYTYRGSTSKVTRASNLLSSTFAHSWRNDSHSEHSQIGFNTIFRKDLNEKITFTTGGEFRYWHGLHFADSELFRKSDGNGGVTTLENVQQRYNYDGFTNNLSVFARLQAKPNEKLTLMLDGQFANYSYKVEELGVKVYDFALEKFTNITFKETQGRSIPDSEYERTYSFFSPKLGANFNLNEKVNFFANYSIAKKEPKVGDWYSRSSGPTDIDLKEETVNTFEIGFGYNASRFSLNANLYLTDFQDKIASVTEQNGDRNTINAGNAQHNGLEMAMAFRVPMKKGANLLLKSNMTFANHYWKDMSVQKIFGINASDVIGKKVPFSPLEMISFGADFTKDNWGISLSNRYWGEYHANYDNTASLPAFNELNAKVFYNLEFKKTKLEFSLGANNILDRDNYAKGAWTRDFNRNDGQAGKYQLYVQQSPLRSLSLTTRVIF